MGLYRIWIGATHSGIPVVGAHMGAGSSDHCACSEKIYPSQMQHRCVAIEDDEYTILTPTEAERRGLEIVAYFPRADGSLSSRR